MPLGEPKNARARTWYARRWSCGCNSGGIRRIRQKIQNRCLCFRESEVSPRNRIFDDQIRLALMLLSGLLEVLPKLYPAWDIGAH